MTNERALGMLKTALDMEEKGKAFYEKAVSSCKNDFGKKMFSSLLQDEVAHTARIKKIYASIEANGTFDKAWDSFKGHTGDLNKMFREFAKKNGANIKADSGDIAALEVGLDLEQKAIAFYNDELKKATDTVERSFIEKMIVEERSHFAIINDTKMYLSDPAAWYSEHEKSGYDGA